MTAMIRLPQQTETEIVSVEHAAHSYRYGYCRAAEARESGDVGQDYLALIEDQSYMAFAICDGISMSYYGDFASRFLGDNLSDWLSSELPAEPWPSRDTLSNQLHSLLVEKAGEARELLKQHEIPAHIKGMLREVLLAKKSLGSGSIYGCGRVDWPCKAFPKGRIILAWQGDVRIRCWSDGNERKGFLGNSFHTREQWNSEAGPVGGTPHVYISDLATWGNNGELLMYTDGLQALDAAENVTSEVMSAVINSESQNPSSDDMSIFHLNWGISPFI